MNQQELRKLILSLSQDVTFWYEGVKACIVPCTITNFGLGYGDFAKDYDDVAVLMSDKVFNGKSLNEICGTLTISCY